MTRRQLVCVVAAVSGLLVVLPASAGASVEHPSVVSDDAADWTAQLVDVGSGPKPRVDAVDHQGDRVYAGGLFDQVRDGNGSLTHARENLFGFDTTGNVLPLFDPDVDGNVWAVEATPNAVYIGGSFSTVDGVDRPALAKLDPLTGAVDTGFDPGFGGGRIDDIELVNGRLFVGGKNGKKLMALSPVTGRNTGYIDLDITDPVPSSWGGVAIYDFAVNPAGTQLVAVGNFTTVDNQSRARLFVADIDPAAQSDGVTVSDWYYEPFSRDCATTHARRVAYLQGVDYSPDGSYFVVVATGQIIKYAADRYETVCDGAGRFNLNDDSQPVWIDYTGGDSVWSVAVTGAAVYVQGHFSWLDNDFGFASQCPTAHLDECDARKGVGAYDPATGEPLSWAPRKPASIGGKQFLATSAGLWIASDSQRIAGEDHFGLAFMPFP